MCVFYFLKWVSFGLVFGLILPDGFFEQEMFVLLPMGLSGFLILYCVFFQMGCVFFRWIFFITGFVFTCFKQIDLSEAGILCLDF